MSLHSRSSSEIEPILYSEVLPVYLEDFIKDFDFYDVQEKVETLFTKEDFKAIRLEKDVKRQIIRLFWVLCSNEAMLVKFLDKLSDYEWLVEKVKGERSKKAEQYIDALKILRSNNHEHVDFNVHRIDLFMKLRSALKTLKPYKNVVLHGDLGTGKKWLALDVCSEFTVMKAMDFKIYWIDVSQCNSPEEDLDKLRRCRLLLGHSNDISSSPTGTMHNNRPMSECSNTILALQQQIREKLLREDYKNCLLVLENVQNVKTFKAFNLGFKILLITRNKKVIEYCSPTLSKHVNINESEGFTESEFFCLFEKYLKCSRTEFPKNATDIYHNTNGHPQLLSIIAKNLRNNKSEMNWNEWINNSKSLKIDDNKFTTVIKTSLKVLKEDQLALYATLAIFPHSISIPVKLLAAIWDVSEINAQRTIAKFYQHSLLEKETQNENSFVKLPYIYSSYLKLNMINNVELHKKVIEYYSVENEEINLCNYLHDKYFFFCIGYHLREVKYIKMFSHLYLNFIFLEQKIRSVGLLNTLGDLKFYEEEIINSEPYFKNLLREIRDFLPTIEEKLLHSKDTCLLQYALIANGLVYEKALSQVKQYPNKVWFTEKGNFHQRRQIVSLPNSAKLVQFLEEDSCLIILDNNNMLLADISLNCNNGPLVIANGDTDIDAQIISVRLFKDNFILTLDHKGKLKLWSIADDRRRTTVHRASSKHKVNPLNFTQNSKIQSKKCNQLINEIKSVKREIVAFYIEHTKTDTYLHFACDNGDVCVLKFKEDHIHERSQFESYHAPTLQTGVKGIRFLCKILGKYYVILNKAGDIQFWNLKESSLAPRCFEWPTHEKLEKSILVCSELCILEWTTSIIFIFSNAILQLTFKNQEMPILDGSVDTWYETSDVHNSITCAKLSTDGKYLVLGTKHGLIVFDTQQKSEILRSNVSEAISCVDIYALDDPIYKYIIVCGSKHKTALNMFSIREAVDKSLGWSHSMSVINNEESSDPQLEPGVWLVGNKLYDINYEDDKLSLIAVDSKNRVHQVHQVDVKNERNWSIITPTETKYRITSITAFKNQAFVGYANGEIFNITDERIEKDLTGQTIEYLQLMDENVLIASTAGQQPITWICDLSKRLKKTYEISARRCFKIFDTNLLLVSRNGDVLVLDIQKDFSIVFHLVDVPRAEIWPVSITGCDLKNSLLFLGTTTNNLYIFSFTYEDNKIKKKNIIKNDGKGEITCLTAANDGSLLAVGLSNGDIEVYKLDIEYKLDFLYELKSHATPICDMKFSPYNNVLVSCSEQLCFWSVSYMLNNPLARTKKRRSSRFSSQNSSDIEDEKNLSTGYNNYLNVNSFNGDFERLKVIENNTSLDPWLNKCGSIDKPELLACIKFDGNKAEKLFTNADFTQFNIIDDEGVYYQLKLLRIEETLYKEESLTNGLKEKKNKNSIVQKADYADDVII